MLVADFSRLCARGKRLASTWQQATTFCPRIGTKCSATKRGHRRAEMQQKKKVSEERIATVYADRFATRHLSRTLTKPSHVPSRFGCSRYQRTISSTVPGRTFLKKDRGTSNGRRKDPRPSRSLAPKRIFSMLPVDKPASRLIVLTSSQESPDLIVREQQGRKRCFRFQVGLEHGRTDRPGWIPTIVSRRVPCVTLNRRNWRRLG